MVKLLSVTPSKKAEKKLDVKLETDSGREKTISIGQRGADDFTKTKDEEQKDRYDDRHRAREDWKLSGVLTSGFWAKHLLWNKPSLRSSIADTKQKFNL